MAVLKRTMVGAALLGFTACLSAADTSLSVKERTEAAFAAAVAVGESPAPCRETIGKEAALALVRFCIEITMATHPPCNTGNQCALIVDHIRYTTLSTDATTLPDTELYKPSDWERINQHPAQ